MMFASKICEGGGKKGKTKEGEREEWREDKRKEKRGRMGGGEGGREEYKDGRGEYPEVPQNHHNH